MSGKTLGRLLFSAAAILLAEFAVFAQSGAYSGYTPYSIFGIGELGSQGSAYNRSMGGVGIAGRNRRYLNYMNPAAVTARDTLSFMADMSLQQNNKVFHQNGIRSVNNTFNVNDLALSFPVYKTVAMMVGLAPYSSTGYAYTSEVESTDVLSKAGSTSYVAQGQGSIYKLFVSAGVMFWDRLSIGVEGIQYFGNIDKANTLTFGNSAYSNISSGSKLILRSTSAKFGLQYEQPVGTGSSIVVGATCSLKSKIRGFATNYEISAGASQNDTLRYVTDTLKYASQRVSIPTEWGVGISYNHRNKWRVEMDYTRSDWTGSGMSEAEGFAVSGTSRITATNSESLRAGFEIVPNRNDVRYFYKRCAYRVGAYYDKSYYLMDGNQVKAYGITFGGTVPVFRYYNGISFAVDFGQRASTAGNMIRERFINFSVGFNIFDYWFQKARYN